MRPAVRLLSCARQTEQEVITCQSGLTDWLHEFQRRRDSGRNGAARPVVLIIGGIRGQNEEKKK